MRLLQLTDEAGGRRVGVVDDGAATLLRGTRTVLELARRAIAEGTGLAALVARLEREGLLDADRALAEGRVLSPLDHPEPARLHVTGTGLTHLGSAAARSGMHAKLAQPDLTDSMRMFKMGLEAGKPGDGGVGVQPEWFYKGDGSIVVRPGAPLSRPAFAQDAGDEPELCGLYVIADDGTPWRVGFALGNEFSDHAMEQVNYLYLAHSKLRECSFGPELLLGALPASVTGAARVRRGTAVVWQGELLSGEEHMTHTVRNLEVHHFKYPFFRRPGDVHVHFFGTGGFSFKDGVTLRDGDVMEIEAEGFGRPLRNPVRFTADTYVEVRAL